MEKRKKGCRGTGKTLVIETKKRKRERDTMGGEKKAASFGTGRAARPVALP